ncbi:hypothetical protein [Lentzea atacamensis]|uniref:hypothetical protein n=1 Tax=Lentzea atacamensis TaxID=531938 RepID=UPI001F4888E4|nr:hypothetical protein [Lentzea atacamensis]
MVPRHGRRHPLLQAVGGAEHRERRRAAAEAAVTGERRRHYHAPAHNISFAGLQFSYTSWLLPSTAEGYADQQTGGYIKGTWNRPADAFTSCASGCSLFEATRPGFNQMPAAVQVSAANAISFSGSKFTNVGQVGIGS